VLSDVVLQFNHWVNFGFRFLRWFQTPVSNFYVWNQVLDVLKNVIKVFVDGDILKHTLFAFI